MEQFNQKLLVEGRDDLHVVYALCQKFNLPKTFDVIDCNGVENLLKQMQVRLKTDISTLGIVIDADDKLQLRWNSIKEIFSKSNIKVEEVLPNQGLFLKVEDYLNIGVWIMPNNSLNGKLEDFIKFLVPQADLLLPIAETTLQNVENLNLNIYQPKDRSKALIHCWLALQKDPGTPLGQSITKRYLDTDVKECSIFINWLNHLFN